MNSEISILITGATGFIGSAVARSLIQRDEFYVRGVARHFSAVLPKKIELAVHDLTRNTDWEGTLKGVEVVVHSAARVHVMKEVASDPLAEFRSVNVDATLNLARQAAAAGVRRFIFLSTIKVNGEATVRGERFHPDGPSTPQDPYAVSKHEAEIKLFKLSAETGLEVVVVRPPLVYGPGVKGNFATMVRWIKKGVPLPLGAIDNRRSLVALDNLVSFIALCADRRISPLAAR